MIDMSKRPVGPLSEVVAQHVATFLKPVFFFAAECGDHLHFVNADDGAVAFSRRLGNECITALALSSCRQHLDGICGRHTLLLQATARTLFCVLGRCPFPKANLWLEIDNRHK